MIAPLGHKDIHCHEYFLLCKLGFSDSYFMCKSLGWMWFVRLISVRSHKLMHEGTGGHEEETTTLEDKCTCISTSSSFFLVFHLHNMPPGVIK